MELNKKSEKDSSCYTVANRRRSMGSVYNIHWVGIEPVLQKFADHYHPQERTYHSRDTVSIVTFKNQESCMSNIG